MIRAIDYLYFIGIAAFTLAGQLMIKSVLNNHGAIPAEWGGKLNYMITVLFNPLVILGFVFAFVAAVLWLAVISKFNLSHAYPYMIACLTLLTVAGSVLFLKETLSITQMAGVLLITAGVVVMSL